MLRLSILVLIVCCFITSCKKDDNGVNPGNSNGQHSQKQKGCTNENALNYDPEAEVDNGNCKLVPKANTPVITKITATWCGPCGDWGWELFKTIEKKAGEETILMSCYSSRKSEFSNEAALKIGNQLSDYRAFPSFCANWKSRQVYPEPPMPPLKFFPDSVFKAVDSIRQQRPVANVGFVTEEQNDSIYVKSVTKFFKDVNDKYDKFYVGIYAIEDGVRGPQNVTDEGIKMKNHHHVMRGSLTESVWGKKLTKGPVKKGEAFRKNFTVTLEDKWNEENVELVMMVFKKNLSYRFINASTVTILE